MASFPLEQPNNVEVTQVSPHGSQSHSDFRKKEAGPLLLDDFLGPVGIGASFDLAPVTSLSSWLSRSLL